MQYPELGHGLKVSALCVGCMPMTLLSWMLQPRAVVRQVRVMASAE